MTASATESMDKDDSDRSPAAATTTTTENNDGTGSATSGSSPAAAAAASEIKKVPLSEPSQPVPAATLSSSSPPNPEEVINVNVGILGHVDSGKTSLVKTLSTLLSTAALDKSKQSRQRGTFVFC